LSLEFRGSIADFTIVSTVQEIEVALAKLPLEDKEAIRNWLDDVIEQQLEVSADFKAKIHRAKDEIAAGEYSRVRKPSGN
jgi:hypothetical protein